MEASLDLPTIDLPQQRRTDWACVVALITYIGVFGLALGLTYPLLSIMMVEVGFSDFMSGVNGSATCVSVVLALFVLPRLLQAFGAFAVVVLCRVGAAGRMLAFPFTDPELAWLALRIVLRACPTIGGAACG